MYLINIATLNKHAYQPFISQPDHGVGLVIDKPSSHLLCVSRDMGTRWWWEAVKTCCKGFKLEDVEPRFVLFQRTARINLPPEFLNIDCKLKLLLIFALIILPSSGRPDLPAVLIFRLSWSLGCLDFRVVSAFTSLSCRKQAVKISM
jgi:hypothetical protein